MRGWLSWILAALWVGGVMSCASDDDPYLWLEEVEGEAPLAWAVEQSRATAAELEAQPGFDALEARLLSILDSPARIPAVVKRGPYLYNFWRDAAHPRGLWRRTTLEEYRKAEPSWDVLLDLDALARDEGENWVWGGVDCLWPEHQRCLVSLSRGGGDAHVVRELDLATRAFVKDGFTLPEAKHDVGWRSRDQIYVGTDFGPGSLTTSGYPRIVKEWQRGTPLAEATVVYEGKSDDMSAVAYRELAKVFELDIVSRRIEFRKSETWVRRDGKLAKIETPDDSNLRVHRDLLFVELRTPWEVGGKKFLAGALLVTDINQFLQGKRDLQVLFEPSERVSLGSYSPTLNFV